MCVPIARARVPVIVTVSRRARARPMTAHSEWRLTRQRMQTDAKCEVGGWRCMSLHVVTHQTRTGLAHEHHVQPNHGHHGPACRRSDERKSGEREGWTSVGFVNSYLLRIVGGSECWTIDWFVCVCAAKSISGLAALAGEDVADADAQCNNLINF